MFFPDFIEHKQLIDVCRVSFEGGEYWDAVSQAMRHLEEKIRKKCGFRGNVSGVDLITKAFDPQNGKLIVLGSECSIYLTYFCLI